MNRSLREQLEDARADSARLRADHHRREEFITNEVMTRFNQQQQQINNLQNRVTQMPQQITEELLDKAIPTLERAVIQAVAQNNNNHSNARAIIAANDHQDHSREIVETTEEEEIQMKAVRFQRSRAPTLPKPRWIFKGPRGPRPQTPHEEPLRGTAQQAVPSTAQKAVPRTAQRAVPRTAQKAVPRTAQKAVPRTAQRAVSSPRMTRNAARSGGVAVPGLVNLEADPYKAAQKRNGKGYRPRRAF
ncbi:hypothetical protein KCV07_g4016, partial [Aureobasidium melanogenum]